MGGIVNKMRGNPEERQMLKNTQLNVEMDSDMELRQAAYQRPPRKLGGVWKPSLQQPIGRKDRPPDRIMWKEMVEEVLYDNNQGGALVRTESGNLSQQMSQSEEEMEEELQELEATAAEDEEWIPLGQKHYHPLAPTGVEEEDEYDEGLLQQGGEDRT